MSRELAARIRVGLEELGIVRQQFDPLICNFARCSCGRYPDVGCLRQMSQVRGDRPAVLSPSLVEVLNEFLAFRHLFRGASIALMRWDKLHPLVTKVDSTYEDARSELEAFADFVEQQTGKA